MLKHIYDDRWLFTSCHGCWRNYWLILFCPSSLGKSQIMERFMSWKFTWRASDFSNLTLECHQWRKCSLQQPRSLLQCTREIFLWRCVVQLLAIDSAITTVYRKLLNNLSLIIFVHIFQRITWESSHLWVLTLSYAQPCCCQRLLVEFLEPSSLLFFPMFHGTPWTSPQESLPSPNGPRRTQKPWPNTLPMTSPTSWSIPTARTQRDSHWPSR